MRISKTDKTNFRAVHIANANNTLKGVSTNFKLYRITEQDREFLDNMYKKTNLRKLMPTITEQEFDVWNSVFNKAVNTAGRPNRTAFLIATDNKPCGIAVSSVDCYNKYKLNNICTFPIETGKRPALAGKTLFRPIFDDFLASGCKQIEVEALKFGPFSPVSKYLQLGFGMYGGSDYVELMRTNRPKVLQTLKKLNELIFYSPVRNMGEPAKTDLFSELSLPLFS